MSGPAIFCAECGGLAQGYLNFNHAERSLCSSAVAGSGKVFPLGMLRACTGFQRATLSETDLRENPTPDQRAEILKVRRELRRGR